jgi:hypothetical protein
MIIMTSHVSRNKSKCYKNGNQLLTYLRYRMRHRQKRERESSCDVSNERRAERESVERVQWEEEEGAAPRDAEGKRKEVRVLCFRLKQR